MKHPYIGAKEAYITITVVSICIGGIFGFSCVDQRSWERAVRQADEQALRSNLATIRTDIRNYAVNNKELPQTLDDLAKGSGRSFSLPDPITGRTDWQMVVGEDPTLLKGKHGIIDVHSASTEISSNGTRYNTW
ncbi:MAG: hypothetical protein ACR2H4_19850 [Pyrinomonadaceae bacterium]